MEGNWSSSNIGTVQPLQVLDKLDYQMSQIIHFVLLLWLHKGIDSTEGLDIQFNIKCKKLRHIITLWKSQVWYTILEGQALFVQKIELQLVFHPDSRKVHSWINAIALNLLFELLNVFRIWSLTFIFLQSKDNFLSIPNKGVSNTQEFDRNIKTKMP